MGTLAGGGAGATPTAPARGRGSAAQTPAGGIVALTGARVINGTGAAPLEQATILIANGRIEGVGTGAAVNIPAGATRVDMSGKTIVPGLINAHGHLNADQSTRPIPEKLAGQLRVYADYGITTVVVLGTGPKDLEDAVKLRDAQESGTLDRARVYVAGPSIRDLKTAEEARTIKVALQQANRNLKTLSDAGVLIAMGTDTGTNLGQWQGYFEHVELEYMVKAGLTPMQTLVAATGGAAKVMKLDRQLGTIQPGKRADLLVLNANPLTDIKNTRQIHSVWIGGRRLATASTN